MAPSDKNISDEWQEIYSTAYIEVMASEGTGDAGQRLATDKAYEKACITIMIKYSISMENLDDILRTYAPMFQEKVTRGSTR